MNFYNIIQNILDTSSKHKNVKEVSEGDIYVYLNSGEHKYPCVFLTVGEVTDSEMSRNVNCTLFYVDRLSSDQSNRTVVQSLGITTLGDILDTIEGDVVSVNYTTFTEKFADMCAGVFATVDITYPLDEVCDEHFEVRRLEITENGIYDTIGYDEFIIEVVNEELVERVEELTANIEQKEQEVEELTANIEQKEVEISQLEDEVSIKEEQINSVTSISITENGTYTPGEGILGWNVVEVNAGGSWQVPDGTVFKSSTFTTVSGLDTSNVTTFNNMFYDCINLTTIPQLDTSKGTDFGVMFGNCSNLTTIPQLNTSNGTSFRYMFNNCSNLTTIPQLDTSKGTDFNRMFGICINLTDIPQLDTSNGTDFSQMFYHCENLTDIPQLNTSNGTNFSNMFYNCYKLTTIPQLNTSSGTNFSNMFYGCNKPTTVPQLNTSNGTNFGSMFNNCSNLTTIPQLDTSKGTAFGSMFNKCSNLTTIPQLNASNGTGFYNMFGDCSKLITITQLDTSKGTNFGFMFDNCASLKNITFTGSINANIDFSPCTLITHESVKSILTACSNTTKPTTSKTLKFNRILTDQNGELATLVADCNSKKWTISGLTLN